MTAPWTPRERRLREALWEYRQCQRRMRDKWSESDQAGKDMLWRSLHKCESLADSALADPPPPDPREVALKEMLAAQEAWGAACHWDAHERPSTPEGYTEGCKRLKETQQRREAAYLAAIAAAKGEK